MIISYRRAACGHGRPTGISSGTFLGGRQEMIIIFASSHSVIRATSVGRDNNTSHTPHKQLTLTSRRRALCVWFIGEGVMGGGGGG